ncbi:MAG: M23/M56 family metallopeptidase [Cellvibrionaceae bacterium]|nr:M23/M56 family metallopeptidase [Cellvibrionaceae bacterium]
MTELIALWLDFLYQQSLWAAILFPGILLAVYGLRKSYPGMLVVIWLLIPLRLLAPTDLSFEYSLASWIGNLPVEFSETTSAIDEPWHQSQIEPVANTPLVEQKLSVWQYLFFVLWLGGFTFSLINFLRARENLNKQIKGAIAIESGEDLQILRNAQRDLSCRRNVTLFKSSDANSAFTLGTINPVICLPGKLWDELDVQDRRAIIYHELAHVKAYDDLLLCCLNLIRCLFFFHPAMCYAQAQITQQRERLTDIVVVQNSSLEPKQYAKALLNYIEKSTLNRFASVAPSVGGQYLLVKLRIEALVENRLNYGFAHKLSSLLLMICLLSFVLPMEAWSESHSEASGVKNQSKTLLFKRPLLSKRISSAFGMRKHPISGKLKQHNGIDLPASLGSHVFAVADGKVVKVVEDRGSKPRYVYIDHGQGIVSRYFQLGNIQVKENDWVRSGQQIAEIGSPYRGTGPHLHFEVMKSQKHVDPMSFFETF